MPVKVNFEVFYDVFYYAGSAFLLVHQYIGEISLWILSTTHLDVGECPVL